MVGVLPRRVLVVVDVVWARKALEAGGRKAYIEEP